MSSTSTVTAPHAPSPLVRVSISTRSAAPSPAKRRPQAQVMGRAWCSAPQEQIQGIGRTWSPAPSAQAACGVREGMTSGEYRDLLLEHAGVPDAHRADDWRAAIEYALGVICGPAVEPYPVLTPEAWAEMRCRDGRRCRCDFCAWEERNRKRVIDWERAQALRPQAAKPYPFGSDADAAEKLMTHARDGASAPSYFGAMLSQARDEASLGARVVRAPSSGRDPAGLYHAGLRADVHRCYIAACSRDDVRVGTSTHEAIRVTLAAQLGHEVPDESQPLARRARRAVRVELAARDLTPPPPSRAARMVQAVEARRAELRRIA